MNEQEKYAILKENENITSGYVMEIKTIQLSAFRILIEALK